MWFLIRALVLWLILLGSAWLMPQIFPPTWGGPDAAPRLYLLGSLSLPAGVFFTWFAARRPPARREARIGFWTVTLGLWSVVVVFLVGGFEEHFRELKVTPVLAVAITIAAAPVVLRLTTFRVSYGPWACRAFWLFTALAWAAMLSYVRARLRASSLATLPHEITPAQVATLSVQLALVVLAGLLVHLRRLPSRQTWAEAATGFALLPAILALAWLHLELQIRSHRRLAVQAWEDSGRGFEAFEKTLVPSVENASLSLARQIVSEWCGDGDFGFNRRPPDRVAILRPLDPKQDLPVPFLWPPSDDFALGIRGFSPEEEENFRTDCRRLLAADPPTRNWRPEGEQPLPDQRKFDYNKFVEFAIAYAGTRLAAGDEAGAAESLAACRRLWERFPPASGFPLFLGFEWRFHYLQRIYLTEAHFHHLQDSPDAIRRDLAAWHRTLDQVTQYYAWKYLRRDWTSQHSFPEQIFHRLPRWSRRPLYQLAWRRESSIYAHALARPATFVFREDTLPEQFTRLDDAYALRLIYQAAAKREQAHLVRTTRARLAQGLPVEGGPSVVFPEARWELTFDPQAYAVTFRIIGAPTWGDAPLDGNGSELVWSYRRPTGK